jgi:hypothetical protein
MTTAIGIDDQKEMLLSLPAAIRFPNDAVPSFLFHRLHRRFEH